MQAHAANLQTCFALEAGGHQRLEGVSAVEDIEVRLRVLIVALDARLIQKESARATVLLAEHCRHIRAADSLPAIRQPLLLQLVRRNQAHTSSAVAS